MSEMEAVQAPAESGGISRREFLKTGGIAAAVLQVAGIAGAGYAAGRAYDSYTGWAEQEGDTQFFNREPYRVDKPTYGVVGPTRRTDPRTEVIFSRHGALSGARRGSDDAPGWDPKDGVEALPEPLSSFYKKNPDRLAMDLLRQDELAPQQRKDREKFDLRWALAMAWSSAYGAVSPDRPDTPPEEWDFRDVREEPFAFKSQDHAAELIKKVAHTFGATLVGIAELNPDWVYSHNVRGGEPGPFKVPGWWKYVIAVTTPHEWDLMYSNPTYGGSSDAYARSSIAGARLADFIRSMGYPARLHSPRNGYDVVAPPIIVDTGLGQQGRFGFTVTPELGANHRPAFVTTDLPMSVDKPIDFGAREFCQNCMICADQCPSGAISDADDYNAVVRGYEKWQLDIEKCYNFWGQVLGNGGCRVCLAVCPYTRKANWLHDAARTAIIADPTGVVDNALIWMQMTFFEYPEVVDYFPPPKGVNASYREGPEWMQIERWIDVPVTWS
jgi:reductive dehalogenase